MGAAGAIFEGAEAVVACLGGDVEGAKAFCEVAAGSAVNQHDLTRRLRGEDRSHVRTFLQTFAGRLSEQGDMIPEFRCYVKGCMQRNKRRDHILVHVGSHVEHRPFQCPQW